jgi:energy-coupling factor transport system ATP-binding protein
VKDLSYEYRGGIRALDLVSLSIHEGDRVAVLGNNGAGKSTLTLNMVGILKPTSGRVLINGRDSQEMEVSEIARWVGLVFQNPFSMLFAKTVYEELAFGPRNVGMKEPEVREVVPEVAKQCLIDHLLGGSPFASSYGEKRRIGVGSILTMKPRCVILDEPTAGQDYRSYSHFMDFVGSLEGRVGALVVITHDPDLAIEYTDRAVVLGDGRVLADGPTREVLADPSILEAGSIRETSLMELSKEVTNGRGVLRLSQLAEALQAEGRLN